MTKQGILFAFFLFSIASEGVWGALSPEQRQFYLNRDFLALEMAKTLESDSRFVQLQKIDLRSCRLVREGKGDIKSVLVCIRFLARERTQNLGGPQSLSLFQEMDRLCSIGAASIPNVNSVLEMNIHWGKLPKSQCLQEILRTARQQIRTLHRKNLIQSWGLYKKVLTELKPSREWQKEISRWSGF